MKKTLSVFLLLMGFNLTGNLWADNDIMTPDGYMGHPAFELGVNGDPSGNSYLENFNYTNYTTVGKSTGDYNYNFNRVYMNVYFPVDTTLTLLGGGSYLFNATGTGTWQTSDTNFTGTENGAITYNYTPIVSWFFAVRVYTK